LQALLVQQAKAFVSVRTPLATMPAPTPLQIVATRVRATVQ
jgi:hypothetical protein